MTSLHALHDLGQSTWLNYLRNSFIRSGEMAGHIENGIQGITANALVYQRAIAGGGDYDEAIRREVAAGTPVRRIYEAMVVDDLQRAADVMRPVFDSSGQLDGFISLELDPSTLSDVTTTVAEVRRLSHHIDRYNVMIEIPATPIGIDAIRDLIADGVSINATHIFSIPVYEQVAQAYIDGLEKYIASHSVWRVTPTAVASFSLGPIDDFVNPLLEEAGRPELTGRTAVAMAKLLYNRFRSIFDGPRWGKLASQGGRVMRPKWTRLTSVDFRYPEQYYVDQLIGPDTIATFSPPVLNAFLRNGGIEPTLTQGMDEASAHMAELAAIGLDIDTITNQIQLKHLEMSDRRFQDLLQSVMKRRDELDREWLPMQSDLHEYEKLVEESLNELCRERIVCRIWNHDHTVWKPQPTEISNRLGWLNIMDPMKANADRLRQFTQTLIDEGFTHALLLGMGGSSLAPELFQNTLGRPARPPNIPFSGLDLLILDTTDAEAVLAVDQALDLSKTIVIIATKSGGTVETLSGFKYFYNRMVDVVGREHAGEHFIGITDPGSGIVDLAHRYQFRDVFLNDPNIGGRYSALSYFGLVPAALVGADLDDLLERAASAASNGWLCDCEMIGRNSAARLGAVLGGLGLANRDKVTFITSRAIAGFGDWAEQLIAESLGKEGKGIVPVVGEPLAPPDAYGDDRLFIHMRLDGDHTADEAVAALIEAGHPVVQIRIRDVYDIGGQFLIWEMATAIAGHILGINPFDQPNVEAAKVKAREIVADYQATGSLPAGDFQPLTSAALRGFLERAKPGDYVALQAYARATPEMDKALNHLRLKIGAIAGEFAGKGLATTLGYGPRFLHSTGQLHKGDRGNGLFIQFVSDAATDVPIPDEAGKPDSSMAFNVLKRAQALGDFRALQSARRRVIAFDVGTDPVAAVTQLADEL